jgi:lipocalin
LDAGLWILTRSSERREPLITKARALAQAMGFDVAVLRDVNHAATCKYA